MINRQNLKYVFAIQLILCCTGSFAAVQSLSAITKTAKNFLEEHFSADSRRVEIRIGKLDPRLRLSPCSAPLTAFVPKGSDLKGNAILGIRCVGATSWHIYVPVHLKIKQKVLKYLHALPKGHQVGPKDVELVEMDISQLREPAVRDASKVIGSVLKRRVRADTVVEPRYLCMVCKGDELIIISGNDRFYVSMEGEALEDGQYGERVKIQNARSQRVITGTVVAKKKVKVDI